MKTINTILSKIENEDDLQLAIKRIDILLRLNRTEQEETELDFLDFLVLDYESKYYPTGNPDPIELIKEEMQDRGWGVKDFARLIGHKSAASEILNRKRPLSLRNMKVIHDEFKISYETLILATEVGGGIDDSNMAA